MGWARVSGVDVHDSVTNALFSETQGLCQYCNVLLKIDCEGSVSQNELKRET